MKHRAAISWLGVVGQAADDARGAEDRQTGQEEPFAAEQVRQAAGGQDQRREHEAVGVDHPLQLAGRGMQLAHQARQRDVDDRDVEINRERREQERDQRHVAAAHAGESSSNALFLSSNNLKSATRPVISGACGATPSTALPPKRST
jgi:hypothetical protein